MHSPAGLARHEQRGPSTAFSLAALSQLQCRADCLPHEQVACFAIGCQCYAHIVGGEVGMTSSGVDLPQAHSTLPLPQQVEDLATVMVNRVVE